ncbi:MAG: PAS domain S-box protein [Chloroflexi bacterium]|nr:PAS domain S-box protein [Chloroflexota bacterium]
MAKGSSKTAPLLLRALGNPHLWIVAAIVALLVVIHYREVFAGVWLLEQIGSVLGFDLTRHTLERILFLIPVAYSAAMLGTGGAISILVLAAIALLPRAFLLSPEPREAMFETGGMLFTGALIVLLFDVLHKAGQRLSQLETTQAMLNLQVKRLSMLHVISSIVSQSLELGQVLDVAIDKVGQLIEIDASWLYLWDKEKRKLALVASSGLYESVVPEALVLGEGLDGAAAQSKQPVINEDMSIDTLNRPMVSRYKGLQSVLIVPLMFKGGMIGTLGVGTRQPHRFPSDEIDLLRAIGDQISMAVENARLYEKERQIAEALRISERNYRELFENASDAIWVHDLNGKILAVNGTLERLTGRTREDLVGADVSVLVPFHGLTLIDREVHDRVLRGEAAEPFELELVKKDGSVVIVQMGTSLITKDDEPWAFQHIARDITEDKRRQENLRVYVQQVTQAQEAERKRIARELHDETAQALVVLSRNLDDLASGNSHISIKDIREQVRNILQGVRQYSQQLRPSILDDLGLLPAVKWLASDLTRNCNITAEVEVVGTPRKLPPETELLLFRIAQEALTNVRRHSEANKAHIKLEFSDHNIDLTVNDNGKGFETPSRLGDLARTGKLGLAGMQERAQLVGGTITIDTKPGIGTTLRVQVPL